MRCKKDVGQVENIAECHFSDYKTNTNREKGEKKRRELAAAHVKHLLYNKYFKMTHVTDHLKSGLSHKMWNKILYKGNSRLILDCLLSQNAFLKD